MAEETVNENLSPEEMVKRRAEITAYYEEHIPSLKIQLEYETMLRDIEKMRAERLQAQMFIAKSMAEPPAAPSAPAMPANAAAARADFDKAAKEANAKSTAKEVAKNIIPPKTKANAK
jgi:hypothetical protein|tara:strand:+ start:389 stop:742 length:354 start_codon:yes stop_codon:yes gene_type:complete